jgi:alpha-glucosidase
MASVVNGTDGRAHGVLMWNSNAMDVVLHPDWVSFRLTGGIVDLFILGGPTPRDVTEQYTRLIGRPVMPPLWAIGFHQSKCVLRPAPMSSLLSDPHPYPSCPSAPTSV